MKAIYRFALLLTALAFTFAACEKPDDPINGDNGNITAKERDIIYSVGNNESHRTLTAEAEWDAMLELFCNHALAGEEVTFYNTSQTTYLHSNAKENRTINTTDRNEIKAWMKAMEKEGRTVRITYDDNTGTWHGEAYATAPTEITSDILIGTWHFNCMVVTHVGTDGNLIGSDLYEPDAGGGTMYYTFTDDGTVTMTMHGIDGTTATDSSTWTLSADGILCSDLMPNGGCWNVNWATPSTMIISRSDIGTENGDIHYQLQFEAVTDAK